MAAPGPVSDGRGEVRRGAERRSLGRLGRGGVVRGEVAAGNGEERPRRSPVRGREAKSGEGSVQKRALGAGTMLQGLQLGWLQEADLGSVRSREEAVGGMWRQAAGHRRRAAVWSPLEARGGRRPGGGCRRRAGQAEASGGRWRAKSREDGRRPATTGSCDAAVASGVVVCCQAKHGRPSGSMVGGGWVKTENVRGGWGPLHRWVERERTWGRGREIREHVELIMPPHRSRRSIREMCFFALSSASNTTDGKDLCRLRFILQTAKYAFYRL